MIVFSYPVGFVLKKTHRHLGCQKGVMYCSRNTLKMLVNECNSQNKKKINWKIICVKDSVIMMWFCDSWLDNVSDVHAIRENKFKFTWTIWLLKRLQSHTVNNLLIVTCTYIFKCDISNNKYILNSRPFRPISYFKHIVNDEKKIAERQEDWKYTCISIKIKDQSKWGGFM